MNFCIRLLLTSFLILFVAACDNPQPGPDKTVAGAMLGAGWGAGAGAVVGNQSSDAGEGAAVGAGFGFVQGAMIGAGFDTNENVLIDQQSELESLEIANEVNRTRLRQIQSELEARRHTSAGGTVYQVYFDVDTTSLRPGAIANLETLAKAIAKSPQASMVHVVGHTDDGGRPSYNKRLAEARARNVGAYLASRGISMDQIKVASHGAKRPIATNSTEVGRQLNRRVDVYVSSQRIS